MVETVPLSASLDHDLALAGPPIASSPRSDSPAGQVPIDTPVGGVSRENPCFLILRRKSGQLC